MAVSFHRGLTREFIRIVQMGGIRVEESDAQKALAGMLTREVDVRGNPIKSDENQNAIRSDAAKVIENAVKKVLDPTVKFDLMKQWEEEHPGESPFPPSFPQVVVSELEMIDPDNPEPTIKAILALARKEMLFG